MNHRAFIVPDISKFIRTVEHTNKHDAKCIYFINFTFTDISYMAMSNFI